MSELLENLFATSNPKPFAKLFKESQTEWGDDPDLFLQAVIDFLPQRLYEHHYDASVPHGFLGVLAAHRARDLFPEKQKWWPSLQRAWELANTRKRRAFDLGSIPPVLDGDRKVRWEEFTVALESNDFPKAWGLMLGFLQDDDKALVARRLLKRAAKDESHHGLKFLYTSLAVQLCESRDWKDAEKILFPAIHFLCVARSRTENFIEMENWASRLTQILQNKGEVSADLLDRAGKLILFDRDPQAGPYALKLLAREGAGLTACFDAMIALGFQAIANSQKGRWTEPVRATLYGFFCRDLVSRVAEADRLLPLLMTAHLIQDAANRSREEKQNRVLGDMLDTLVPTDTFSVLRSLVSHSDPYASANAVGTILEMGESKHTELWQSFATLAAKNDGRSGNGYDLLLVVACAECFASINPDYRNRLALTTGFFLGRILKNYEMISAYGVK